MKGRKVQRVVEGVERDRDFIQTTLAVHVPSKLSLIRQIALKSFRNVSNNLDFHTLLGKPAPGVIAVPQISSRVPRKLAVFFPATNLTFSKYE